MWMYPLGLGSHNLFSSLLYLVVVFFDGLHLLEAPLMGSGNYTYDCGHKDKIWNAVRMEKSAN